MKPDYILHLLNLQREEVKKDLDKQSVIEQFSNMIEKADSKTLEFIMCQLLLLQSFMEDGE
ncbi:MAG: hypothetical protein K0Q73_7935 [Paenibacillus sp.]|jgi:hypothetical protein|nr:hypothetical protein [Paenibacillus sp.]